MLFRIISTILSLCIIFFPTTILADATTFPDNELIIGIKESPPFAMKNEDGRWEGISVTLWESIADELNISFQYRELPLQDILDSLANGELDAGFAALTITAEREKTIDFSHPYYTTGLGITVKKGGKPEGVQLLKGFFSLNFLKAVVSLMLLLGGIGLLVWFFEKDANKEQFGGGPARGIGAGFWWAAVTMTTVGYGDKAPRTSAGRLVAIFWMFTAIIVISGFTAAITSSLTISGMRPLVTGPNDLVHVRTGTVSSSTSADFLKEKHVSYQRFTSPAEGLQALAAGEIDAFVYDAPLLRYLVKKNHEEELEVLQNVFRTQQYGIGLAQDSNLRETINRSLLKKMDSQEWRDLLFSYLGR
ncbi:MAG: transporter substrate-binding domain-containing protein [Thermodesulfobacteriota bacterium]